MHRWLLQGSVPVAFVDPNMVGRDGLIPAAVEFVTGFIVEPLAVGSVIRARDEDGVTYTATIQRVAGDLLYLLLQPPAQSWPPAGQSPIAAPIRLTSASTQVSLRMETRGSEYLVGSSR